MTTEHHINIIRNLNEADGEAVPNRKPSYVGLSCAVSGYSSFVRYTSPSRKASPPQQFHVSSEPQVLDSTNNNNNMRQDGGGAGASPPVRGQEQNGDSTDMATPLYYPSSSHTHRKVVQTGGGITTVTETVTKFYHHNNNNNNSTTREVSPGSSDDASSVGSGSSSSATSASAGGNLIQKQIERLYGSRVQTVQRVTSPDFIKSSDTSVDSSPETLSDTTNGSGGFFAKRFGIVKQKDHSNRRPASSDRTPSFGEVQPLKVPAVFRLLRPEFREQLKTNSCQVKIPSDLSRKSSSNGEERVIPIQVETAAAKAGGERLIPVVRDSQPFNGRIKNTNYNNNNNDSTPLSSRSKPALPAKPLSPTRQQQVRSPSPPKQKEVQVEAAKPIQEPIEVEKEQPEKSESIKDDDQFDQDEDDEQYPCGLRERSLLCPIQEEDTESTTSGSSFKPTAVIPPLSSTTTCSGDAAPDQKVQDGHYFIKMLENEIFKFEEQICDFEEDLADAKGIPEDIRDCIFATVGKAKLLMSQKLVQFRGLCDKNITFTVEEDPFVPTSGDLAGFWDMVYIQVEHIHSLFAELVEIRKNGWKRPEEPKINGVSNSSSPQKAKKGKAKRNPGGGSGPKNGQKSEAAKARDEARRKMLEEKKRQMKLKKKGEGEGEVEVELFLPL